MSIFGKIFGDENERQVSRAMPLVSLAGKFEEILEKKTDKELEAQTVIFRNRLSQGESLDNILPEVFATVREAAKRTLKQRAFDTQLLGAIFLHRGNIVEMRTGEGKTLTATFASYLNALEGKGVHVVTVNDYLARRDVAWMGQIYDFLGLKVACLNHDKSFIYDAAFKAPEDGKETIRDELGNFYVVEDYLRPCSKAEAYAADITYGTNNEFGFDYLRDNMAYAPNEVLRLGFNFAIVDEVDSILIDEARTPLIISGMLPEQPDDYYKFARIAAQIKKGEDYQLDEKHKNLKFEDKGEDKVTDLLGNDPWQSIDFKTIHRLENAVRAKEFFVIDRDYVVRGNEIVIVDEFTGRLMPGRRWSEGLHQAVEAKEHVFGNSIVEVKPESVTLATITFQNLFRRYKKLAGMTGTAETSAEEFDKVYKMNVITIPTHKPAIRKDLPDKIFKSESAKFSSIVSDIKDLHKAGRPVLVGTRSIEKNEYLSKLLNIEGIEHEVLNAKNHEREAQIIAQAGKAGKVTIATNMAGRGVDIILGGNPPNAQEAEEVKKNGGLHVIGSERHEARRIDNQLRGRAGRQGDPGSSQFYVSLEDDLMRIFGGEKLKAVMDKLNLPEEEAIESGVVSNAIESAQKKVEGMNFDARKYLLEYDDVMSKHRDYFYKERAEILFMDPRALDEKFLSLSSEYGRSVPEFEAKKKELGEENHSFMLRFAFLKVMDALWMEHLENMSHLRDSSGLQAYAHQDPLVEYKTKSHNLFQNLLKSIKENVVEGYYGIKPKPSAEMAQPARQLQKKSYSNVDRNDPCPCGSGKKYKRCHGK
ncbi:MAG TPA: preprotein translocase subunit SecA [Candidatus Pacearchaeota archaeon]|nr:preprotein translocase subunit SecA [Candidatus Pacearchaeota archaeon]